MYNINLNMEPVGEYEIKISNIQKMVKRSLNVSKNGDKAPFNLIELIDDVGNKVTLKIIYDAKK